VHRWLCACAPALLRLPENWAAPSACPAPPLGCFHTPASDPVHALSPTGRTSSAAPKPPLPASRPRRWTPALRCLTRRPGRPGLAVTGPRRSAVPSGRCRITTPVTTSVAIASLARRSGAAPGLSGTSSPSTFARRPQQTSSRRSTQARAVGHSTQRPASEWLQLRPRSPSLRQLGSAPNMARRPALAPAQGPVDALAVAAAQ
jgi:hypothetical protein